MAEKGEREILKALVGLPVGAPKYFNETRPGFRLRLGARRGVVRGLSRQISGLVPQRDLSTYVWLSHSRALSHCHTYS